MTLICTIDDVAYQWEIDNTKYFPNRTQYVQINNSAVTVGPFKFYVISTPYSGNSAILEVVAFSGISNLISCTGKKEKTGTSQTIKIDIAGRSLPLLNTILLSIFPSLFVLP